MTTWRTSYECINFEQRWVRLYTRKRRGGQLEAVYKPMNKTLYGTLYARWKRRDKSDPHVLQYNQDELDHMMGNLCKRANVKPFGFHAIRHHVASVINDSRKASMKQIQRLLRHRRQNTTEVYLHSIDNDLRRAAKLLERKGVRRGTLQIVKKKNLERA